MKENRVIFTVPNGVNSERADKVLAQAFNTWSRTEIQKAFDSNKIYYQSSPIPKNKKISAGDILNVLLPEEKMTEIHPVSMELDILYEDEHIVAINKQPGIVVHPGNGIQKDTLVHGVLNHCLGNLSSLGGGLRPGVVHRLDKETSGVILFAKTHKSYLSLIEQFKTRSVQKEYLALVSRVPALLSGIIREPIARHPVDRVKMCVHPKGKHARTDWALERVIHENFALLRCWLHTGRTHQIRVHLSYLGHPIIGDFIYGYEPQSVNADCIQNQEMDVRVMLHAECIQFLHPIEKTSIAIKAPIPIDFQVWLA